MEYKVIKKELVNVGKREKFISLVSISTLEAISVLIKDYSAGINVYEVIEKRIVDDYKIADKEYIRKLINFILFNAATNISNNVYNYANILKEFEERINDNE